MRENPHIRGNDVYFYGKLIQWVEIDRQAFCWSAATAASYFSDAIKNPIDSYL